jgi:hypothetical protein
VVVERLLNQLDAVTTKLVGSLLISRLKVKRLPIEFHLFEGLFVRVLLGRSIGDLLKHILDPVKIVLKEALETAKRLGTFDTAKVEFGVDLLDVTLLETLCAKGTDHGQVLLKLVDFCLKVLRKSKRPLLLALDTGLLLESVAETSDTRSDAFVLLLNIVWNKSLEHVSFPGLLALHPVTAETPKLLVGLDLLLALVNLGPFTQVGVQIFLLLVDVSHRLGQSGKCLVDVFDLIVVFFFFLLDVVVFELVNFGFDFVQLLLELLGLNHQALFDLLTLEL